MLIAIGGFIGEFVKTDEKNFDGGWKSFFRVRVVVNVTKPLKKGMKLKRDDGEWAFVDFKYERLPTFCFLCGVLEHGDKYCPFLLRGGEAKTEKPYGAWLRAGGRRLMPTAGQRWLAPDTAAERENWKAPGSVGLESNPDQ